MISTEESLPCISAMSVLLAVAILAMPLQHAWGDSDDDDDDDHHEEYHADYIFGVPFEPSAAWQLSSGGRIYDNWFNALGADEPESTHPVWPSANTTESGSTTWRCKSCHGWDYKGTDGQYGSGDYKTGIAGVSHMTGRAPSDLVKILSDANHQYTDEMIPNEARIRVGAFLSEGMHDTDVHIADDGKVLGDAETGKAIFQNVCAACHGFDGRAINWGDDDESAFVGTESNANPWEVLHKIRNGHPGYEMVSLRAFPIEYAVDTLAYAQTLPEE